MTAFCEPTPEQITKLSGSWCASYSGGKDSTSLVTWLEWLRRDGRIDVPKPQMVRSDTGVEEQDLVGVAEELTRLLEQSGWECAVVKPDVHERLYPQILGRGLPPIHPGVRRLRWCTRSTKIDPMRRWKVAHSGGLELTGLRLGESAMRDGKLLKKPSCSAGGECGIPDPGEGRYSPIINWTTCNVWAWLCGDIAEIPKSVRDSIADILTVTARLYEIYDVQRGATLADWNGPTYTSARFGCIGCPAIGAEARAPRSAVRRNGTDSPLNELYDVWFEARMPANRLQGPKTRIGGPIRMEARKRLFGRVMDIQRRSGVVLITSEDEAFIRDCWARKVYPRGWSEDDELTKPPVDTTQPTLPGLSGVT